MNTFDLVILTILVVSTSLGAWRGMVRELVSVLTWGMSIVLAWFFASRAGRLFESWVGPGVIQQMLGFALVFSVTFILGLVASWLLRKYFPSGRAFRLANTLLGGTIGAIRGTLIIVTLFLIGGLTAMPQSAWWRESGFSPFFERAAVFASAYLPRDIARHIRYS